MIGRHDELVNVAQDRVQMIDHVAQVDLWKAIERIPIQFQNSIAYSTRPNTLTLVTLEM